MGPVPKPRVKLGHEFVQAANNTKQKTIYLKKILHEQQYNSCDTANDPNGLLMNANANESNHIPMFMEYNIYGIQIHAVSIL